MPCHVVRSGHMGCEVQTEGVVTGRVRSLSSRFGRALCWPRIAEIPLQRLTLTAALVLCIHTGSLICLAMMNGGVLFPLMKGIFCVQKMRRNDRSRDNRGTAFAHHERLPSSKLGWVETGGTHQPDRARKGCVYVKVSIIVAVTGGVFVSDRQVDLASAEARESKLGAALPC